MEPTNQGEAATEVAKLSQVIQIDEGKVQAHLGEVVRSTVEETLNALLDASVGQTAPRSRHEVGHAAALPGHEPLGQSERSGMNARARACGSPEGKPSTATRPMLQQMCEKLWTLPPAVHHS